jgi:hypothetical protein
MPTCSTALWEPIPYGLHSRIAFAPLREPIATFSSPLRELMPYGFRSPIPLFPDPPAIRPRYSLLYRLCYYRSKQVYGLMPRIEMKAIYALGDLQWSIYVLVGKIPSGGYVCMSTRPSYVTILIRAIRAYIDLSWAANNIKCEVARKGSLNLNH